MIKAIVFDFGGVIEINTAGHLLEKISGLVGVSETVFIEEYFKHNHLSNVHNVPWEEMIMRVVSVFDTSEKTKQEVLDFSKKYQSKKKINFDLLNLLPILKQQGLKIGIFSNNASGLRQRLIETGIIKLVDEVVISGEIGFQKPHKEAFQVLFEKLKLPPEEVIFVDDSPKSLEKEKEIGYTAILFKNNEQLKGDLKKLGISVD